MGTLASMAITRCVSLLLLALAGSALAVTYGGNYPWVGIPYKMATQGYSPLALTEEATIKALNWTYISMLPDGNFNPDLSLWTFTGHVYALTFPWTLART